MWGYAFVCNAEVMVFPFLGSILGAYWGSVLGVTVLGVRLSLLSLLGLGMTGFSFFGTDFTDYTDFFFCYPGARIQKTHNPEDEDVMGLVVQLVYMTSVFSATASNILMTSESSIALDSLTFISSPECIWKRLVGECFPSMHCRMGN